MGSPLARLKRADRRQLWALVERAAPRAATALTSVALALLVSPEEVGVFALGIVVLTLVQALTDVGARQSLLLHWARGETRVFIRRFTAIAVPGSVLAMAGGLTVVALVATGADRSSFALLIPLLVVPGLAILSMPYMVGLQAGGHWRQATTSQGIGAIAGLAVGLVVMIATRSILGSAVQFVVAEAVTLLLAASAGRRRITPVDGEDAPGVARDYVLTSSYAVLGWGQGQVDRLALGAWAGASTLGLYTFASQVSRSLAEASAQGTSSVLRADLGQTDSSADRRTLGGIASRAMVRSTFLVAGVATVSIVGAAVLALVLDPDWRPALLVVPLFAASGFGTAAAWNITALLQRLGLVARAMWVRIIGVGMAFPIAWAASHSLGLAASLVVLREIVVALLLGLACGRSAPVRGLVTACSWTAAFSLLGVVALWIF
ncbi:oligosaccharide flippase family protein [Cellulomonas palmilytica]|uniref:oligosaccharide flippase family protein n=1 Tax=Cellulomonas palmilytica TaxID=2608402 RepID=UPI001F2E7E41|nr:oligosaccharide flippase family protein [Cellulomonas palmilytica]UJP41012.1 oligosaccharide flippase family protein [Cellulomonas palmilytica]